MVGMWEEDGVLLVKKASSQEMTVFSVSVASASPLLLPPTSIDRRPLRRMEMCLLVSLAGTANRAAGAGDGFQ